MPDERPIPGRTIEIVGGSADGDTFFVAENQLKVDAFDGLTTKPLVIDDGEPTVFAYMTFLGKDARTGEPAGVTIMMLPEMLIGIAKGARTLWANIPIQFRETKYDKRGDASEVPGTIPEG